MPVYRGKKKGGNHSSLIKEAEIVVQTIQRLEAVKKISPGFIVGGSKREKVRVKVKQEPAALLVTVSGSNAVQELRVYTTDPTEVTATIERLF